MAPKDQVVLLVIVAIILFYATKWVKGKITKRPGHKWMAVWYFIAPFIFLLFYIFRTVVLSKYEVIYCIVILGVITVYSWLRSYKELKKSN